MLLEAKTGRRSEPKECKAEDSWERLSREGPLDEKPDLIRACPDALDYLALYERKIGIRLPKLDSGRRLKRKV